MMDTAPLGPLPPNVAHPVPIPTSGPSNHYDHSGHSGHSHGGHGPTNGAGTAEPMPSSSSHVDGNNIGNNDDYNRNFPYAARGKSSVNPETGSVTSSKDDEATYLDDDDDDDSDRSNSEYPEQVEIKPDPMALLERPRRIKRERDGGWDDGDDDDDGDADYNADYERQQTMQLRRNKGGRLRDPIWRFYHQIGLNQWQCNDCDYTSLRPQADRLRKHREKCPGLEGQRIADGGSGIDRYLTTDSSKPMPNLSQFSKMSANAITRHLRRIADALEESNKLKKLKLGLDPTIPFDGEIPRQN